MWVRGPLLNAFALGWAVSMVISSTVVPRLVIDGAISFLFVPLFQLVYAPGGVYGDPELVKLRLQPDVSVSLPSASRSFSAWVSGVLALVGFAALLARRPGQRAAA